MKVKTLIHKSIMNKERKKKKKRTISFIILSSTCHGSMTLTFPDNEPKREHSKKLNNFITMSKKNFTSHNLII